VLRFEREPTATPEPYGTGLDGTRGIGWERHELWLASSTEPLVDPAEEVRLPECGGAQLGVFVAAGRASLVRFDGSAWTGSSMHWPLRWRASTLV